MKAARTPLPEQRAAATKQRILDAAYSVFARRGYGSASVDEIIAEADLSKGALYHYYASKESLFQALLDDRARRCSERMASAIVSGASVRDNVENVLRAGWSVLFEGDAAWPALQMEFWVHATREEWAREAIGEAFRQCREFLAEAIAEAQKAGSVRPELDPNAAALLMIALSDGVMAHWQVEPGDVQPDRLIEPMADMIASYLTCRTS